MQTHCNIPNANLPLSDHFWELISKNIVQNYHIYDRIHYDM